MRLSDLIKIDNRFEKAINLGLDLNSQEKIDHYIPTRSAMNILGDYIDSVRVFSGNRARVLIGPYGKGKSHLLLILLAILSQEQNVNLSDLFHRMEIVNPEVAKAARTVMDTTGPMLPVIINSNGNTLSQDFMRAIVKALNAAGLKDIVPDSYYSEATKMIRTWKSQFPDTYRAFEAQLGNIGAEKFIRALKKYDERALSQFRKIYPALTSGAAFNPIVDDEIVAVYQSVNRALRVKHGYGGIFIIFDEFSKKRALEGDDVDEETAIQGLSSGIIQLPLVLDGPFSTLSNENTHMVAQKLPEFAEQVIIFMLDKDWESSGLEKFTDNTYCYHIHKDERSASSSLAKDGEM